MAVSRCRHISPHAHTPAPHVLIILHILTTLCLCLDCSPSITSPPRTPLGPLNAAPPNCARGQETRTPQEDRLMKKVSKRNHRGETPLHCSAIKVGPAQAHPALATAILTQGNVAMVRKLLRMGADPNTQDNAGTASSQLWPCLDVGKLSTLARLVPAARGV